MAKKNPRENPDYKRTSLWVMMTTEEMAQLKTKCELANTNIGEYTRELIVKDLKAKDLKAKKKPE